MKPQVDLLVWGEYACFTRPEFKAERESYPIITPSAARGLLEAIYWKPQMRYRIQQIHIHRRGRRFSLLRNELKDRQNPANTAGVFIDDQGGKMHQQRTSLVLRDVAYRIIAWIDLRADEPDEKLGKHLDCFRRRVERGGYHHKPCLGCREFPADFSLFNATDLPIQVPRERESNFTEDFGTMLFDTAYVPAKGDDGEIEFYRHSHRSRRVIKGSAHRLFFKASARLGIVDVPQGKYQELDKLEGRSWDFFRS